MALQVVARSRFTKPELQAFTQDVANAFNAGDIRAPVHLSGGNEAQLIDIFSEVRPCDWVCSTWRSHYHCLLKGVPWDRLMQDILAGRSISLCYPSYRVISSAIVAGNLPIAVGLAWALKDQNSNDRVWAFSGDMAATTGVFNECVRYSLGHKLPITFVVEDNGKSVCTDTAKVWGAGIGKPGEDYYTSMKIIYYKYDLPWPHSGAGKRVNF